VADLLDVRAVLPHREELQRPLAAADRLRGDEVVAVRGEDDPAVRRPGAAGIEDADARMVAGRISGGEAAAVAGVGVSAWVVSRTSWPVTSWSL
jgi:hypothetical protein